MVQAVEVGDVAGGWSVRLPGDMRGLVAVARGALLGLGEQDEFSRVLLALLMEVERFLERQQRGEAVGPARELLLWDVRDALRRGETVRERLRPLLRRLESEGAS